MWRMILEFLYKTMSASSPDSAPDQKLWKDWPPPDNLVENLNSNFDLTDHLGGNSDFSIRKFNIGSTDMHAAIVYISIRSLREC
ncbi:hypothetical protein J2Z65_005382 [Paenibacillus aceris]|uniref:Uncharacterized protein n=1 Tax=Paenibacillus aceris TaxID=869555 RepID=A0ABS4I5D1_9BACL|nr:hypothetical protein [Paenibacillus aceris]